jgi:hypothetical protein
MGGIDVAVIHQDDDEPEMLSDEEEFVVIFLFYSIFAH